MQVHHEYRVNAFGAGGRNGVVHAEGVLPCISFSAPPEFLGEPGRWTPERAAVASCFVSTFSGIAERARLEFASFNLDAEGMLDNEDGFWRFTEIKLRPVVTVLKEEDLDRAIRLLEKAEKSCLIARSLQFKVVLFPAVKIEEELTVPARISTEHTQRLQGGHRNAVQVGAAFQPGSSASQL
ncbi:MAG: osmotically inducible protein OsmC [Acidobacteria bacterium]|nr:MAG: osmotically inducible protein OsmC [Acidobacteriota bacterium]